MCSSNKECNCAVSLQGANRDFVPHMCSSNKECNCSGASAALRKGQICASNDASPPNPQGQVCASDGASAALRKGQIYVIDFIISFAIFMLLIVVAYSSWSSGVGRAGEDLEARQAYAAASSVLSSVIDYGGFPSGWAINATDPSAPWLKGIGCAKRPGELDATRLSAANAFFNSSSYSNATRAKMGFGRFNGDIRVQEQGGAYLYIFGAPPDSNQTVLASASRMALLSGQPVWVRARIWRPSYP